MGHHTELGRKTNANHRYFANTPYVNNGGGYLKDIARIEAESDEGPKRDQALAPLLDRARNHFEETKRWHEQNVKAAGEHFETQRPHVIQRNVVQANPSMMAVARDLRATLEGSPTSELTAMAETAAKSRNVGQLFALRQEALARISKGDGTAAPIIAILNSAHLDQQQEALADFVGAKYALAMHEHSGERCDDSLVIRDPSKYSHVFANVRTFVNDQGQPDALTDSEAQALCFQAGATDVNHADDPKAADNQTRLAERLGGKLDFLKPATVAGSPLPIAREPVAA